MGVTLFVLVLIILLIAALWCRRRRNLTNSKPNTHGMVTDPNRHELLTTANVHEMEQEKQGVLGTPKELNNRPHQLEVQPSETHELDPNSRILRPELESNEYPSLYELETTSKPAATVSSPSIATSRPGSSVSRKPVAGSTAEGDDDKGMRILQDRIERIREEKERLQKIQELEVLEEETKRAILEKASKRGRDENSINR